MIPVFTFIFKGRGGNDYVSPRLADGAEREQLRLRASEERQADNARQISRHAEKEEEAKGPTQRGPPVEIRRRASL